MKILDSVHQLLEHIKEVERDTIELSQKSLLSITALIEKHKLEIDDDTAEALQYQDIISQQLSATIDAINGVQKSMSIYSHTFSEDESMAAESIDKLQSKLSGLLDVAKQKREAFSGNLDHHQSDEVEFF